MPPRRSAPYRPHLTKRTARLDVRPIGLADFDAWRRGNEGRLPQQTLYDAPPRPREQLDRRFFRQLVGTHVERRKRDKSYVFGLFLRDGREMVGVASVYVVARGWVQLGWLGYEVYNQHWRKGYAREGVAAVIELSFRELRLHSLEAGIQPQNRPSRALARALGMKKQAAISKSLWAKGAWRDIVVYARRAAGQVGRAPPFVKPDTLE